MTEKQILRKGKRGVNFILLASVRTPQHHSFMTNIKTYIPDLKT